MRWLYRLLWIAAWTEWFYLGFGLFHGLPRSLGPVVGKLWLQPNEVVVGFLGDEHKVVLEQSSLGSLRAAYGQPITYSVCDVDTGQREPLPDYVRDRHIGAWSGGRVELPRFPSPRKRVGGGAYEDWGKPFGLSLSARWATVTQVDPGTGYVLMRLWAKEPYFSESRDETLAVCQDGTVVRMPPSPNWPLFLFVQTLLALPLVGTWLFLRWRRHRLARLAP